jgi:hypothetical protein
MPSKASARRLKREKDHARQTCNSQKKLITQLQKELERELDQAVCERRETDRKYNELVDRCAGEIEVLIDREKDTRLGLEKVIAEKNATITRLKEQSGNALTMALNILKTLKHGGSPGEGFVWDAVDVCFEAHKNLSATPEANVAAIEARIWDQAGEHCLVENRQMRKLIGQCGRCEVFKCPAAVFKDKADKLRAATKKERRG